MPAPFSPPRNVSDLLSPQKQADLKRLEDFVNALAQLKVQIVNSDGTPAGSGTIQLNGAVGVLTIVLS